MFKDISTVNAELRTACKELLGWIDMPEPHGCGGRDGHLPGPVRSAIQMMREALKGEQDAVSNKRRAG